jgi:energy-coupling factor transporter ATP-binding protein EcfA2
MMGDLETKLLEWSGQLSAWKQDLLRRLAAGEHLGTAEYRELADAAEHEELSKPAPWYRARPTVADRAFTPLDATHLTATIVGGAPVQVAKVVHLEGANDLAPGATLEFRLDGLTVIAGKNGSGKSGYTRILKQVAATRASEPVLPNAFAQGTVIPKAVVTYQVGSTPPALDLTWESGADRAETPMQRARVFDARSADVHLAGSTQIAYLPPALQILGEYTQGLQEVGAIIEADLRQMNLQSRHWPSLEVGVGLAIFNELGDENALILLQGLVALTDEEVTELAAIPATLRDLTSSNPASLAVQARQRAAQLGLLARNLQQIAEKLSAENVNVSKELLSSVAAAKLDVDAARMVLDDANTLADTGNESWQRMWIAATEFAQGDGDGHEHDFPVGAAVCPLCAQSLAPEAQTRFELFAHFMSGEAQTKMTTARDLRERDVESLLSLPFDTLITQELVDLVGTYDESASRLLLPRIADAIGLRDSLLAGGEDGSPVPPESLLADFAAIVAVLKAAGIQEEDAATALAATDNSALAVAQLSARYDELNLRKGIVAEREAIGDQHDRAITINRLEAAKAACGTTGASRKNSELSQNYVDKVCAQFEIEAKSLGLERVPVELVFDRSSRGHSYIKVSLKNAPEIQVASVLSEGEQRVTAIAGFFADLTESGDSSTLVFDDPVSSLDQEYRVKVAQRLLREAEARQVLVFTHDFSFVQYLYEEKRNRDVALAAAGLPPAAALNYIHIARAREGAGVPTEAEVWRHVSVKERLGRLKVRQQSAAVLYRNQDLIGYEKEVRDIIGAIRETWEVFVEQELLYGVVTRHERSVQTQRLGKLVDLTVQDVATVELGMTIESRYMTGHAAPISDGSAPQDPMWVLAEIDALDTFRKVVIDRR